MSKKEICIANNREGYWSALNGAELNYIEYGIEDYAYVTTGAWNGHPKYHRLKIHYCENDKPAYIICNGYKLPFNECIKG